VLAFGCRHGQHRFCYLFVTRVSNRFNAWPANEKVSASGAETEQ